MKPNASIVTLFKKMKLISFVIEINIEVSILFIFIKNVIYITHYTGQG